MSLHQSDLVLDAEQAVLPYCGAEINLRQSKRTGTHQ